MSTEAIDNELDKASTIIRTAWGVGGLVALVIGVLLLVWPGKTADVVAAIIAIYAIVTGLVYLGLGIFAKRYGVWVRIGHLVLGALFIVGGVIALANLRATTLVLAAVLGITIGILWIIEGVTALTLLRGVPSKVWVIIYAVITIIAGVILLFSPIYGALALWWLLGISLVVMGAIQIVRALRFSAERL
ncbi:HdeD family acid-resistance protein [Raineyella sp.]|uniref:HdeD family acid-resistance protein n=1 Tax=Raineyella sp. TaxID=1911550 RepID=UPI002B2025E7|nr:DUF308 domain-containing protein [Raineyella sp.]MEA5154814.1 DUF308 domain-containing protein [Raineyella sp.]